MALAVSCRRPLLRPCPVHSVRCSASNRAQMRVRRRWRVRASLPSDGRPPTRAWRSPGRWSPTPIRSCELRIRGGRRDRGSDGDCSRVPPASAPIDSPMSPRGRPRNTARPPGSRGRAPGRWAPSPRVGSGPRIPGLDHGVHSPQNPPRQESDEGRSYTGGDPSHAKGSVGVGILAYSTFTHRSAVEVQLTYMRFGFDASLSGPRGTGFRSKDTVLGPAAPLTNVS